MDPNYNYQAQMTASQLLQQQQQLQHRQQQQQQQQQQGPHAYPGQIPIQHQVVSPQLHQMHATNTHHSPPQLRHNTLTQHMDLGSNTLTPQQQQYLLALQQQQYQQQYQQQQ
ncbi:hypothetical protein BGZ82_002979, partial [Podila clonocystis]